MRPTGVVRSTFDNRRTSRTASARPIASSASSGRFPKILLLSAMVRATCSGAWLETPTSGLPRREGSGGPKVTQGPGRWRLRVRTPESRGEYWRPGYIIGSASRDSTRSAVDWNIPALRSENVGLYGDTTWIAPTVAVHPWSRRLWDRPSRILASLITPIPGVNAVIRNGTPFTSRTGTPSIQPRGPPPAGPGPAPEEGARPGRGGG